MLPATFSHISLEKQMRKKAAEEYFNDFSFYIK
jgi:hypothetical protein